MTRQFKKDVSLHGIVSRIKGFILDSQVENYEHIIEMLSGNPMSEDVAQREFEESNIRTERVKHLAPLLYLFANSMAEGLVEHQRAHLEEAEDEEVEEELTEKMWNATERVFAEIAFTTTVGAVSQLLDMGLISTSKKRRWFWKTR
jgi:hypothetical protein